MKEVIMNLGVIASINFGTQKNTVIVIMLTLTI